MSTGFNDMRENVFSVLRDDDRTFVTENDVDRWLMEGVEEVSTRLRLGHGESTGSTDGTNVIPLPADYVDVIWLELAENAETYKDDYVEWVDEDVWNSFEHFTGTPPRVLGRVFNNQIEMYPTPASGLAFTLRYWASSPTSLTGFTGTLKTRVVNYARAHAKWKEGEMDQGTLYFQLFEAGMPPPYTGNKNHPPGPITLRFVGNAFDNDPDAAHQ